MNQKRTSSSRGYSLLEQAAVLPILLGVILGTVDVNNALQAYSALKAAVHTSLRCIYTVDGKCIEVQADTRPRLYDYYLSAGPVSQVYQEVDFKGEAKFFNLPQKEYRDFRAITLDQVLFSIPRYNYDATRNWYHAESPADYVRQLSGFPWITGADPRDPNFRYFEKRGEDYKESSYGSFDAFEGNSPLTIAAGSSKESKWIKVGTINLVQPVTDASRPCYKSIPYDEPPSGDNTEFSANCSNELSDSSRIVMHVKGDSEGTHSNSCAKVLLKLDPPPPGLSDLGGQVYRGPASQQNFLPRGSPVDHLDPDFPDYDEFELYNEVRLKYNTPYTVKLKIQRLDSISCPPPNEDEQCSCDDDLLKWTFKTVNVYTPQYDQQKPTVTCAELLPAGRSPTTCTPLSPYEDMPQVALGTPTLDTSGPPAQVEMHSISATYNEQSVPAKLVSDFGIPEGEVVEFAISESGVASPEGRTQTCPANYGVTTLPHDGFIWEGSEASPLCPPQDLPPGVSESSLLELRWLEKSEPVSHDPIPWTQATCFTPPPTQSSFPDDLPLYKKLSWSGPITTGSEPYYTGPESDGYPDQDPSDPDVIKATNSEYDCSDITITRFIYDQEEPNVPESSLFSGFRPNLDLCEWQKTLRDEAVNLLDMPTKAFFAPERTYVSEIEVQAPPPDSCTYWKLNYGQATDLHLVDGGPFPEGTVPEVCQAPDTSCVSLFSKFGDGAPGTTLYDTAAASDFGWQELKAQLPWAQWNCSGPTCSKIEVSNNLASGQITSVGSIEVPMNLLLNRTFTMTYTGQERWEGELAR